MMPPSQKRAYVSQETAERLADLRLEVSRREGRVVSTDFVVAGLVNDHTVLARMGTMIDAAIESLVDDAGGCMASMPSLIAAKVRLQTACKALEGLKAEIPDGTNRPTGAAELFEHPKGMQFTVSIGIPEIRILGAADPEREARLAMIEWLEAQD